MTDTATDSYIVFDLAGTAYGVPSRMVHHIEMVEHVTPVPNAAAFVDGVVFSRGQVIPAINLRTRFGFERIPYNLQTRLVILSAGERTVGLIVDTARQFVTIPAAAIQPPPEAISGLSGKYLDGIATVGGRLMLILNVQQVLDWADAIAADNLASIQTA